MVGVSVYCLVCFALAEVCDFDCLGVLCMCSYVMHSPM